MADEFGCTHGPNAVCIRCMGKRNAQKKPPSPAQSPTPAASSASAQQQQKTKKAAPLLGCAHGPGMVCPNCVGAAAKTPPPRCTHPPGAMCIHCMAKKKPPPAATTAAVAAAAAAAKATAGQWRRSSKCTHGPNGRCLHCIPPPAAAAIDDENEDDDEEEAPELTCPNHGPHGSCLACMARRDARKVRVRRQADPRCVQVRVDRAALDAFQQYVRMHRSDAFAWCAWLLGAHDADGGTSVLAVYDPPRAQDWAAALGKEEDDDDDPVWKLAAMLGLRRVGWVFSHSAQRAAAALTAREVAFAARMQARHGPHNFVTLALALGSSSAKIEAFQASDQAVDLARRGKIVGGGGDEADNKLQLATPVVAEGADTTALDPAWVTVAVPLVALPKERCMFAMCSFPPGNRPDSPVMPSDFKEHLEKARKAGVSPFSDFHFLAHLAQIGTFDAAADLPLICASVVSKHPRDAEDIAGYLMLLDAISESMQ